MQIQKTDFFNNDEIYSNDIINLKPQSWSFRLRGTYFNYSASKKQFCGLNSDYLNQSFPQIIQFLTNLNIQYTTREIAKRSSSIDTEIAINCDNPCDFISKLKKVNTDKIVSDVKVIYESEEFLKKAPYSRDFFARNIKTMIHDSAYCTIYLKFNSSDENIEISLSGNSIIIYGSIQEQCHLIDLIQNITSDNTFLKMSDTKSFHVSNDSNNKIDLNQVNELFNCTLDYFPYLEITYIYIGFNDYSL